MYKSSVPVLVAAIVAGLSSWANGQQSGWSPTQINATMCAWRALRGAQLMDTAYLDGGFLFWTAGLANGDYDTPSLDGNPLGLTYTLNFSIPFDSKTNFSSILDTISLATGGQATNNLKPNYYDGAMLANDHEFALYGGLLMYTDGYDLPDADQVLYYRASGDGAPAQKFIPGFTGGKLPDNLTRYVTYGGAANAPSENKAWYFGGSRSPSWGPIYQPYNDSFNPTNVSNTLITLDLSESESEKWTNATLPPNIPSRANPSVVWVPVGDQGILVVLGGVAYPEYNNGDAESLNIAQSEKVSPGYMSNIDIYDVASGEWYQQPTIKGPDYQVAMGCAVVGSARDFSSHNIYYYGGFDGLHEDQDFHDEVWVLSLPSFTWTNLTASRRKYARAGHQCLTPYPDQMVTIGGFRSTNGGGVLCLENNSMLQVFNLTSGQWLDSYDPSNWNEYGVPEMIHNKIGGDYAGGATVTAPSPSWATTELASVFATKYPTSKITTYYPYSSQSPANGTRPDWDNGKGGGGGGGTPSWVAPVLGVVLGLVFVTAIVVAILLYKRRSLWKKRNSGTDSSGGEERHHNIRTWLNNNNAEKAPTITTEDPSSRYSDTRSPNSTPMPARGDIVYSPIPEMAHQESQEMPVNTRFELGDTSRAELSNEASPYAIEHSGLYSPNSPHSGSQHSAPKPTSFLADSVSQGQPSSLSSSQVGINPPTAAAATGRERSESPALGSHDHRRTQQLKRNAVVSDVTISDHRISHLRSLSDETVSSATNTVPSPPTTPPATQSGFNSGLVSPPWPSPNIVDEHEARDYMSMSQSMGANAHAGPSRGSAPSGSSRLSAFSEDLGDRPPQAHTR
ncbi:hypothetical protein F4803DRAFT_576167 [Xylaria telfairii]|nr:hypothetical protein F4803DRAFT_576167 [Xylaria telfairii]